MRKTKKKMIPETIPVSVPDVGEIKRRVVTMIMAAIGFTVALFWANAIISTVRTFVPETEVWSAQLMVAILVTIIAGFATYYLSKLNV